jgi:SAM-dependent methyltransferase
VRARNYYWLFRERYRLIRERSAFQHILKRGAHRGFCPICNQRTIFYKVGDVMREHCVCFWCCSIPRWRAMVRVLNEHFPNWRNLRIHESSPDGAIYDFLRRECENYIASQFFPDQALGSQYHGFRCEDLGKQSFPDAHFDLAITQDVLEHLRDPMSALREISRTLKPGGAHVFTVPWYPSQKTLIRAQMDDHGNVESIEDPIYHGNPVDSSGALVITDWGDDLCDTIYAAAGMITTIVEIHDTSMGIESIEVFISRKPDHDLESLTVGWRQRENRKARSRTPHL